jgi:hypothetical protein
VRARTEIPMSLVKVIPDTTWGRNGSFSRGVGRKTSKRQATDRRSNIDQCRPSPLIAILLPRRMPIRQSSPRRAHERPRDVRAKLDGDPDRDDEVDERDRVQADVPHAHDSEDIDRREEHGQDDDGSGAP